MNQDWSQKNKEIQILLGKKATYKEGIEKLISFREELFEQISNIVNGYPKEAFSKMPFKGANGYHSKTMAYSIWHIFRIEDIVAHELIHKNQQILFSGSYVPYKIGKLQIQGFSEPTTPNKIKQSYHITQKAARSRPRAAFLRGKLGRRQDFSKK